MSAGPEGWISMFGGGTLAAAVALAVLLGLRHATDPDHLTAVSTIVVSDAEAGARRAGRLGLAWGLGHGATLFLCGLPVVVVGRGLPSAAHRGAELAVGAVIVALAVRLLRRWRRGYFHTHPHEHGGVLHSHPHFHRPGRSADHSPRRHQHRHGDALDRSPGAAFGVGLVHGVGGSAGAGVLLLTAISGRIEAMAALLVFAGATAVSMALVSAGVGHLLAAGRTLSGYVERGVPAFGVASLGVGVWYSLAALGVVPLWG